MLSRRVVVDAFGTVALRTCAVAAAATSLFVTVPSISATSSSSPRRCNVHSSTRTRSSSCFVGGSIASRSSATCTSRTAASLAMTPQPFTVAQVPCLSDNYGYLLHDPKTGHTAAVDTPDADAYRDELTKRGWTLTHILNTHHHWDHTGGNLSLKSSDPNIKIIGPKAEQDRIPGIDIAVSEGDSVPFGETEAQVLDVGGHTLGHVAFHFPAEKKVFVGDALFSMGCGRMFEGTAPQFWKSLQTIRNLPDETTVYCAHEYTEANAKFAVSVEPGNKDLQARVAEMKETRKRGEPTVPFLLGEDKKTNPFLRVDVSEEIRRNVGAGEKEEMSAVFGKVRKAKDTFRG